MYGRDPVVGGQVLDYINGPGFVKWLLEQVGTDSGYRPGNEDGLSRVGLTEAQRRRIYDWRHGGQAHFASADAICVALGLHLSEVPEELWEKGNRVGRPPKRLNIEDVKRLHAEGLSNAKIARQLACTRSNIEKHLKNLGLRPNPGSHYDR